MAITNGTIEKTPFESLRAQVALANHDLTLEATLVQSAANQVKAAGHVPVGHRLVVVASAHGRLDHQHANRSRIGPAVHEQRDEHRRHAGSST